MHIVDEDGDEQPTGEVGQIWFESPARFEYHNDPEKTAAAFNEQGWSTLGDVGYVDDDGYLYLTDRVSHMIISGGVNIYPQEIENVLAMHPAVADVAVIGVPDAEMGEEVKAVVQPADPCGARPRVRGRAHPLLPRADRALQVPDLGRLRRRAAAPADRQAAEARAARPLPGGRVIRPRSKRGEPWMS